MIGQTRKRNQIKSEKRTQKKFEVSSTIQYKNIIVLPSFHNKILFSIELRRLFYYIMPEIIAVEFPKNLKDIIMKGIDRLPALSAILYNDEINGSSVIIPIDPADSLIEATRVGLEYNCEIEFVDVFIKNYFPEFFNTPDEEAIESIGFQDFYSNVSSVLHLQAELIKLSNKKGKQEDIETREDNHKYSERSNELFSNVEQMDSYREFYMASALSKIIEDNPNKKILFVCGMSHWKNIRQHLELGEVDHSILGFEPEIETTLFNITQENSHEFFIEIPNIVYRFTQHRNFNKQFIDDLTIEDNIEYKEKVDKLIAFDRKEELKKIIFTARERYKQEYDEDISIHKMKSLFQYVRNLTLVKGRLFPSLFNLILAAKSIIGDDFAFTLYEECTNYPDSKDYDEQYENLELQNPLLNEKEYFTIRRFKPNYGEIDLQYKIPLKRRPSKKEIVRWKKEFEHSHGAVSYPPEDIFEENFFRYVRTRSLQVFQEFYTRTHEFTSTLLDGIDFKETLRNWTINQKIYVNEKIPIKGEVDGVVFIFNENKFGESTKFRNRWMFYGEHDQESDLALYSTFPGEIIVGPGISRIEVGGIVSFFPRGHVFDVWMAKEMRNFRQKLVSDAEILLLAAIIFGEKKFISYVGPNKPRGILYDIAGHYNKSIIYLPLSRFSQTTISSVRNLHILKDRSVREYAGEFIKKRRY